MSELRYSRFVYGIAPQRERFPEHMRPLESAPTQSVDPVAIVDVSGAKHPCLYYRGEWNKTRMHWDPYAGRNRIMMSGETIRQPIGWVSS
jgi:hypothetical protein